MRRAFATFQTVSFVRRIGRPNVCKMRCLQEKGISLMSVSALALDGGTMIASRNKKPAEARTSIAQSGCTVRHAFS
jgi:hypothetical protein